MRSVNPFNNKIEAEYTEHSSEEINSKLLQSDEAFQLWKQKEFTQRARILRKTAVILIEEAEKLAALMTAEMGKLTRSGVAEIKKCAWVCEYYAENAEHFLKPEFFETDASTSYVTFKPLGPILSVMPWNFPFWQVFRFATPALMAGNTALLKHASNVCGCALAIEQVFIKAGLPENVFQTLLIKNTMVKEVIEHNSITAVTLTGSTPAGRAVASAAGSALKKTVLELGGNDPYIILADADLELAAEACFTSRMINAGQSCISAKRFIAHAAIYDEFVMKITGLMKKVKLGDPLDPATELGPLAREDLRDELHAQVTESIRQGAVCLTGGYIPELPGAFYPPTVLTNVKSGMPAYHEELFGPVAVILKAENKTDAVRIANDSRFGLGAAVFTSNLKQGEIIAAIELDAGCTFVNDFVRSDPRLPFGGIKASGYGRELSVWGIREFVNTKTVYIK
jgi:succinate-semialdehyde dehydrogenase / glutarate-semialdehyde dehydrogenase